MEKDRECKNCYWSMESRQGKNNKLCVHELPQLAIHGTSFPIVQEWYKCRFHQYENEVMNEIQTLKTVLSGVI